MNLLFESLNCVKRLFPNKKSPRNLVGFFILSDRDRIRTCDRLLRRQMLYPAELRDLVIFQNSFLKVISRFAKLPVPI